MCEEVKDEEGTRRMWVATRDVKGCGRRDGEMVGDVVQYGMEVGVAPNDWRKAQIIPIYKKGSRLECSNYRGISLLSVVGKVCKGAK